MLFGEDLGGRHEGGLVSGFDHFEHSGNGDSGFAGSDVALEETMHGEVGLQVAADFGDGAFLGTS